jgi:hypothetical protein
MKNTPSITDKMILAKLRRKGGKTARELGVPLHRMYKLQRASAVKPQDARRRTGQRGRPAVQWEIV